MVETLDSAGLVFPNLKSRQSFWFPIDTRPDFASLNLPNQLEGQAVSLDFAYTRCLGLTRDAAGAGVVHVWLFHLAQTLSQHSHQNFPEYQADLYRPNVALEQFLRDGMSRTCD